MRCHGGQHRHSDRQQQARMQSNSNLRGLGDDLHRQHRLLRGTGLHRGQMRGQADGVFRFSGRWRVRRNLGRDLLSRNRVQQSVLLRSVGLHAAHQNLPQRVGLSAGDPVAPRGMPRVQVGSQVHLLGLGQVQRRFLCLHLQLPRVVLHQRLLRPLNRRPAAGLRGGHPKLL
jgi:hypothetical protein